jgi:hypothetical protein
LRNDNPFLQLCFLLRQDMGRGDLTGRDLDWSGIIALANRHRVTPALWFNLRQKQLDDIVPAAIRSTMANIYTLNNQRNRVIKSEAVEALDRLATAHITPVLLKTVVNMFEASNAELGIWITRDIDLLVKQASLTQAASTLISAGYKASVPYDPTLHSYPPLSKPGKVVTLDVHRDIGPQRNVLSVEDAMAEAWPLPGHDKALILSPTHRLVHLLYHSEIQDRRYELGKISLHQLLNFIYLTERFSDQIDWREAQLRLSNAGGRRILSAYCYTAERLLGITHRNWPPATTRARLHFRRCMVQKAVPMLERAVEIWGVITPHMSRHRIDYAIGQSRGAVFRFLHRARITYGFIQRNGIQIVGTIEKVRQLRARK